LSTRIQQLDVWIVAPSGMYWITTHPECPRVRAYAFFIVGANPRMNVFFGLFNLNSWELSDRLRAKNVPGGSLGLLLGLLLSLLPFAMLTGLL
jgi:hypothetical protein